VSLVSGVDVFVGGHSHTFLGNWRIIGQGVHDQYPVVVKGKDGGRTLVVQAGEFGKVVGNLRVDFAADGTVAAWEAVPVAVVGTLWYRMGDLPDPEGKSTKVQFLRGAEGTRVQVYAPGGAYSDTTPDRAAWFLPWLDKLEAAMALHPELVPARDDGEALAIITGSGMN